MLASCAVRAATVDCGEVYAALRDELSEICVQTSVDQLGLRVAATPAWTVRDVLAHVVGIAADLNALRFDPDPDEWTRAQVERRRGLAVASIVDEWRRESVRFEEGLRALGYEIGSHYVADLHAHLQDVRTTLGLGRQQASLVVAVSLDFYLGSLDDALAGSDTAIEVVAGRERHRAGGSVLRAEVQGDPFEILRAMSARRSRRQIRALYWQGDPDAVLDQFARYPLPDADLVD